MRPTDKFKHEDFNHSCHAFIMNGSLYCRNADQAKMLDEGKVPPND